MLTVGWEFHPLLFPSGAASGSRLLRAPAVPGLLAADRQETAQSERGMCVCSRGADP